MTKSYNLPISIFWKLLIFFALSLSFFVLSLIMPVSNIVPDPDSDMYNYYWFWIEPYTFNLKDLASHYEPGFVIYARILRYFSSFSTFIWTIKFLIFYSFFHLASKLYENVFIVLGLSLITFFFFVPFVDLANVIIRQGLATALLFLYLSRVDIGSIKFKNIIFLSVFLMFFHYSAIFVSFALILYYYMKGISVFLIWCIVNVLYIIDVPGKVGLFVYEWMGVSTVSLDVNLVEEHIDFVIGFKPMYLFVSTSFVIVPLMLSLSGLLTIRVKGLLTLPLFRFYFILNSLAVFTSLKPFHDRFFDWSWAIGPLLIIYSFHFLKYKVRFL